MDTTNTHKYKYTHYLIQTTQHDNGHTLELPHHPPEVFHCVHKRGLGSYVGIGSPIVSLYGMMDVVYHGDIHIESSLTSIQLALMYSDSCLVRARLRLSEGWECEE